MKSKLIAVTAPKYSPDDRIVVRMENGIFIGTVTRFLPDEREYVVRLDNGVITTLKSRSSRILGLGIADTRKTAIGDSDLHRYLIDGWEGEFDRELPTKVSNLVRSGTPLQNYVMVRDALFACYTDTASAPAFSDENLRSLYEHLNSSRSPLYRESCRLTRSQVKKAVQVLADALYLFSRKTPGSVTVKHRRMWQTLSDRGIVAGFVDVLKGDN